MDEIGYDRFDGALVVETVLAQLDRAEHSIGVLLGVEKRLPDDRVEAVLDGLTAAPAGLEREKQQEQEQEQKEGEDILRRPSSALWDLISGLVARRLETGPVSPEQVARWLAPLRASGGYARGRKDRLGDAFRRDETLRREMQRLLLLEQPGEGGAWQRAWRLLELSAGLNVDEGDAVALLAGLASDDDRWRDIVQLVPHSAADGSAVRSAAARFADADPEAVQWLASLPVPRRREWEVEQDRKRAEREAERIEAWRGHRADFGGHVGEMRAGEYGYVINPAKAYLKLFQDMGDEATDGPGRLIEWLGSDLAAAAMEGFDVFLLAEPPVPTALEMAESHAEGRRWEAAYIIVSALAERLRTGRGFADLPEERLMAGAVELTQTRIDDHAGIRGLEDALIATLRERGAWLDAQRMMIEPQLARRSTHVSGLYQLIRSERDAAPVSLLAEEWLERFPMMAGEPEAELIDRLLASGKVAALVNLLAARRGGMAEMGDERRRNWLSVGLIVDFDATVAEIGAHGPEAELLWNLRARLGDRRRQEVVATLGPRQLGWAVASFRSLHPFARRPASVTTGDANPWDATEYLATLIQRLGDDATEEAAGQLETLRAAPADDYSDLIRVAASEQRRKRVEAAWMPPDLAAVVSTVEDAPPTTPAQLRVVVVEALEGVAAKLRGSDVDWYQDFFRDVIPKTEDQCRDTVLKMLRLPFGITAAPEGHLADDKRCDILFQLADMIVPLEMKGQWHSEVWRAADRQLDRLYSNDWRSEGGVYMVLWFGPDSAKPPAPPPKGVAAPTSAAELRDGLIALSATARDGRSDVVVLDLTRPG